MKPYTPEKLVAVSRYRRYVPTLSRELQSDIFARIRELIEDEQQYCDKGNFKHMAQIFTSIALYQTLQKHGKSEEEAYKITSFLSASGTAPGQAGATNGIWMIRRTASTLNAGSASTAASSRSRI